jgi:flagellar motor switch protein FliG
MRKLAGKLRKAAILVSSLDEETAERLLEQMPAEVVAKVRRAMVELEDLDHVEQRRVLHEFLQDPDYKEHLPPTEGVELSPELQRKLETSHQKPAHRCTSRPHTLPAESSPRFRFLHQASTDDLARLLQSQHPQLAAVVLSQLAPERAGRVLSHFTADMQLEILERIADSRQADTNVLLELEQYLQQQLLQFSHAPDADSPGLSTVQAILRAIPRQGNSELWARLQQGDKELWEHLANLSPQASPPAVATPLQARHSRDEGSPPDDDDGVYDAEPLLLRFPSTTPRDDQVQPSMSNWPAAGERPWQFSDVPRLPQAELARLFQAVAPRDVLVALAGADQDFVNRILTDLPPGDAQRLQQQLGGLTRLRREEIQAAQQRLVDRAAALWPRGARTSPGSRPATAAA